MKPEQIDELFVDRPDEGTV